MTLKHISLTSEKQKVLDKLTFGFEIEGFFARSLQDLNLKSSYGKRKAKYQQDGSVHLNSSDAPFSDFAMTGNSISTNSLEDEEEADRLPCDYCSGSGELNNDCDCFEEGNTDLICDIEDSDDHSHDNDCYEPLCEGNSDFHVSECYECSGRVWFRDDGYIGDVYIATEYASAVFSDLGLVLDDLARFDNETHLYNESCGLHFHIGTRSGRDQKKLWSLVGNMEFLKSLHELALTFCKCQKQRLENTTRFCEFFETPENLIAEFQKSEKYRFVRFHQEYGTLEFRFFTPCKHKIENVQKLVNAILEFAITSESYHAEAKTDEVQHQENILVPLKIASISELEAMKQKNNRLFDYFNNMRDKVARFNASWDYEISRYNNASKEKLQRALAENNHDHLFEVDDHMLRMIEIGETGGVFSKHQLREAKLLLEEVMLQNNEPVIIKSRAFEIWLKNKTKEEPEITNSLDPLYGRSEAMLNFFIDYNGKRKVNAPMVLTERERNIQRATRRTLTRQEELTRMVEFSDNMTISATAIID